MPKSTANRNSLTQDILETRYVYKKKNKEINKEKDPEFTEEMWSKEIMDGMKERSETIPLVELEDVEEDYEDYEDYVEPTQEEIQTMQQFMSSRPRNVDLAGMILEKIQEKERKENQTVSNTKEEMQEKLHPEIVKVYKQIGVLMKRYKGGKLPKAFKILPNLKYWEEAIWLTNPEGWSAHATFQTTRIFASNFRDDMAMKFFNIILLPKVRESMAKRPKLHPQLFFALQKACYKPMAFFRGIVIPLCESGDASYKECHAVGAVIKRKSFPVLASAGAIVKIVQIPYNGTYDTILKCLLEKKYALPTSAIHALVVYFHQFCGEKRPLPVVWHETLLLFVRLYKSDISRPQRQKLALATLHHSNASITPLVRALLNIKKSFYTKEGKKI